MKAVPSFQNHVKSDIDSDDVEFVNPKTKDSIDFSKSYGDRRKARKTRSGRRYDPVFFVDLEGSADYVKLLSNCVDEDAILNIKGAFANLHYTFTLIEDSTESNNQRRVSLML